MIKTSAGKELRVGHELANLISQYLLLSGRTERARRGCWRGA